MRRTKRRVDAAIVRSLSHVRLVLAVALAILGAFGAVRGNEFAAVAIGGAVIVGVSALVEPRLRRKMHPGRLSIVIVIIDLVATLAALGAHDVAPGEPASLLLALPLVHAGVRHGMLGAISSGLVVALSVFGQLALTWDGTPGQADDPLVLAIVLLFVAVPGARLSEHVTDRLRSADAERGRTRRRAAALELVMNAGVQMLDADRREHDPMLVATAQQFVGITAVVTHAPDDLAHDGRAVITSTGDGSESVASVQLGLGQASGRMLRLEGSRNALDDITIDALELLTAMARAHARDSRTTTPIVDAPSTHLATHLATDLATDLASRLASRSATMAWLDDRLTRGGDLTIAVVSLDNLKLLNDLHGNVAGNALIEATIERLTRVDPTATVGRLVGGDFLVATDALDVDRSMISSALSGGVDLGTAGTTRIHCGVGLTSTTPQRADTAEQLLRRAMSDMYEDKRAQNASFLDAAADDLHVTADDVPVTVDDLDDVYGDLVL